MNEIFEILSTIPWWMWLFNIFIAYVVWNSTVKDEF